MVQLETEDKTETKQPIAIKAPSWFLTWFVFNKYLISKCRSNFTVDRYYFHSTGFHTAESSYNKPMKKARQVSY